MIEDGENLLAAIAAQPQDMYPRQVFADWLAENDFDQWEEFVRWQLANPEVYSTRNGAAVVLGNTTKATALKGATYNRLHNWFEQHSRSVIERALNVLTPAFLGVWHWRRGFVEKIEMTSTEWLVHHPVLMKTYPIREVHLRTRLGWSGNGVSPGQRPSLYGGQTGYVNHTPFNPNGEYLYHCERAVTPVYGLQGRVLGGEDMLLEIIAQEWPTIKITMRPSRSFETQGDPRPRPRHSRV